MLYIILLILLIICLIFPNFFNFVINELKSKSTKKQNSRFYNIETIYPKLNNIKKIHKNILDELSKIDNSNWESWPETHLYEKTDGWKIFPFMAFGIWSIENCKKMPILTKFLKSFPNLKLATLSKMSGNMSLRPHDGWANHSNYVLRCHYGLIVPDKQCYVTVIENSKDHNKKIISEDRYHETGKWLVFDDSKTHYATNKSNQDRIVLILDLERPVYIEKGQS